ncbi:hypothetical protein [Paenibacillus bovis]|uniref:DUF3221 domain-containing protein n=1 Tax=Paenibacillus bovis TaxID=1616788 RepID=A0A172ZG72_9BACL|nr:hypothetical protein [Paenibacillus bovis]ANF96645.1 hypothetical protein AR543_11925 [Paenibacillus bovis]
MRHKTYALCWSAALLSGAILLSGCDVITAQNIPANGGSGMNGGGMGMNGGPGRNGSSMRGMMNADIIGKVISVNGNMLNIELMEQSRNGTKSEASAGQTRTDTKGSSTADSSTSAPRPDRNSLPDKNGSSDAERSTTGTPQQSPGRDGGGPELNSTGEKKTLKVSEEVQISEGPGMMPQMSTKPSTSATDPTNPANPIAGSELQLSDLKAGETVMIWYKQNTETVERITVM